MASGDVRPKPSPPGVPTMLTVTAETWTDSEWADPSSAPPRGRWRTFASEGIAAEEWEKAGATKRAMRITANAATVMAQIEKPCRSNAEPRPAVARSTGLSSTASARGLAATSGFTGPERFARLFTEPPTT